MSTWCECGHPHAKEHCAQLACPCMLVPTPKFPRALVDRPKPKPPRELVDRPKPKPPRELARLILALHDDQADHTKRLAELGCKLAEAVLAFPSRKKIPRR